MAKSTVYDTHLKIRPRPVKGYWQNLRKISLIFLLTGFTFLPFFNWHGRQAVWFDLSQRRFYIFDINIWPQDFILLTFVLMALALTLFFITAILGRIWCGYACPHTVYTEVFLWIEQKIEGNRSEQLKLERLAWGKEKCLKRGAKYLAWGAVALQTGFSFVGYFYPIRQLIPEFFTATLPFAAYFWVLLYGGFTYMQAGIVREKFCKFMCPYARFQGAMFDRNTLIIAYDEARGEPRRRLRKKDREAPESLGFCVDCTMCVQVCPTGIDIRDGLQLECIACAACIDACDNMMDQIGAPRGLVRYTSSNALSKTQQTRFLRPKTLTYALMLLLTLVLLSLSLSTKKTVELNILRDRNVLARQIGEQAQNSYTIKILNKTEKPRSFILSAEGLSALEIVGNKPIEVAAGQVHESIVRIQAPMNTLTSPSAEISFTVQAIDNQKDSVSHRTTFIRPKQSIPRSQPLKKAAP